MNSTGDDIGKIETRIAVLLFLPDDISATIQKEEAGVYYQNHESSIPHITLYSCRFDDSKYSELVEKLREIKMEKFLAHLGKLQISKHDKNNNIFVAFEIEDAGKLLELHEKVLEIANPLRGSLIREKDVKRFEKGIFTAEEFSAIEKYGYQYVKQYFNPHITIGEIQNDDPELLTLLRDHLVGLEGAIIPIEKIFVKILRRTVPEDKKIYESELTEILIGSSID